MELKQLTLAQNQLQELKSYTDSEEVTTVLKDLQHLINMYEENILETPSNDNGDDVIIPNFIMVEYRSLRKIKNDLENAIQLNTLKQNTSKCQQESLQ